MRVVILCGGSGSRLWPASRKSLPKQFISLFNGKSLLDLTVERVLGLVKKKKPIFVCNKSYGFLIKKTLNKYKLKADLLLEPEGKDTCAAIYLAAKHCSKNENLLIMPSDHLIPDTQKFMDDVSFLEKKITQESWITLGIKPKHPSEAYGYIKVKKKSGNIKKVLGFIEKPQKSMATKFIDDIDYYWNAGIFIANANMIINSIKKFAPEIASKCDLNQNNRNVNKTTNEVNFSAELFSKIPSKSIDYAVMEYEKNLFLYPFKSDWDDVGSWDSIVRLKNEETSEDKIIQIDSHNNFIKSEKRVIATIGIKDLIIIDSDDATLISKKNQSEKVKTIVDELFKKNIVEAKEHSFEYRPWGKFENLIEEKHCKVKKILIFPEKRLSLQYHNFRSEHWLIVSGLAKVHLDGKELILSSGQSVDIPCKSQHFVENLNKEDLIIIETQLGTYFGEDDIVRLDDPYSR